MDGRTSKETPIAKYLANLEKRKSLFGGKATTTSPSPTPAWFPFVSTSRRTTGGTQMKINFDDTFFSRNDNESILHISPPVVPGTKRRRVSIYSDENENVEALHKKISDLERILRQTQSELVDGQAACTKLDQINAEARRSFNEKVIALEKSHEDMNLKCKNATERADSMEKQLLRVQRRDSDSTRDFQTQVTTQLNKISSLEATVASLHQKNQELTVKLTEQSINGEQTAMRMQQKLDEAEKVCAKAKQDAEVSQAQLLQIETRLQKTLAELEEAKTEAARNAGFRKEYEAVVEEKKNLNKVENLLVMEKLKSQDLTKQLRKLQEENDILKSTVQREHLLKEQKMSAETEISVLKEQLRVKGDIEGERNNLRNQIKAWIAVATKLDVSCRTPLDFDGTFRKTQDLLLELKHENSTLQHTTENDKQKIASLESEVKEVKERIQALDTEKGKLNSDLRKLTRRLALILQDRDSLRGLMESYENDFDDSVPSGTNPQKLRISQLEQLLSEYEATFAEDASLKKPCEECLHHVTAIQNLQSELESTKTENATLSRTVMEANQTVTEDPTTGLKIVSFGRNPSMLSIEARLKECVAENELLKANLRKCQDEDTIVAVSDADLLQEKNDLEDRLKSLERRHAILTESYDYETVQLQNACTKLFGYYVILNRGGTDSPNQFRLQNISSSGPDETFIFQEGNAGDMLLLDTPILAHFQDDIEKFLRQDCSVPAFLAAVTIAYSQGMQFPTTSQLSAVDAALYEDEDVTMGQESMQILATESISCVPAGREVQIEIEGEDDEEDEDVGDEIGSEGEESEGDEEIYDEEEEVDYVDDDRDDDAEGDDDDDDVVMLD